MYVPLCMCVCVCVCVCVHMSVYIQAHVSSSVLYRSNVTFDTHSSLVIFDEHLVWQINQGLLKILPQCPVEILLAVW